MERLTYMEGGKWRMRIGDTEYSGKEADRVSDYENTGLSPQEIEQLKGEVFGLRFDKQELEQYRSLGPIDRLRELVEADKDGRCVVLPVRGYTDKDGEQALNSAMNTCFYHNNPVTRYIADAVAEKLTREAAEAALKGDQHEQNL